MKPLSMFLMDVTGSSAVTGDGLESYMNQMVQWMQRWTTGIAKTRVKYRRGDEIVFISENYSTAYILAFYIRCVWKMRDHAPYFGMSYGLSEFGIEDIHDLETWTHPMFKFARNALERLKQDKLGARRHMCMQAGMWADPFAVEHINHWLWMEQAWEKLQTPHQQHVYSLFAIHGVQNELAHNVLRRSPSTVSKLLERGHAHTLLEISGIIEGLLNHQQVQSTDTDEFDVTQTFRASIRENIKRDLDTVFDQEPLI